MSSDSQDLLSQPDRGAFSGGGSLGGGSSGGGSSGGGGDSYSGGVFSEVPVTMDPGSVLDFNTMIANAVNPLVEEIKKLKKEVRSRLICTKLEMETEKVVSTFHCFKQVVFLHFMLVEIV